MSATFIATPAYNLDTVRNQFEITEKGLAYFNHAGMSPFPKPVKQAMIKAIEAIAAHGSDAYATVLDPLHEALPARAAMFVNTVPESITFIPNTSTGINLIAQSMPLKAGDNILLCDVEFPSNVYPWMNLYKKDVETRLVPSVHGGVNIEEFEKSRDERTRVVAVSAVQFFTGRREDLYAIGDYCAAHGLWFVVDGIQAAGIVPLDVKAMGIHALATGGQKALCGPPGQGFMAIVPELLEELDPIFVGAKSVDGWDHWLNYDLTPASGAARFLMGTANIPGLAGLHAALGFLMDIGVQNITDWVTHLTGIAIDDLKTRGYDVITPSEPEHRAHIVTFKWEGDAPSAVEALQNTGVILREHQDTDGNSYLRLSAHCYNLQEDIYRVGEALEGMDL